MVLAVVIALTIFAGVFTAMFWTIEGPPTWWLRRRFDEGDVIGARYATFINLYTSLGDPRIAVIVATNRESLVLQVPGRTWAVSWKEAQRAEIYHVPSEVGSV